MHGAAAFEAIASGLGVVVYSNPFRKREKIKGFVYVCNVECRVGYLGMYGLFVEKVWGL